MKILELVHDKKYLFLAVFFSVFMAFLYPFVQVLPQGLNNFWFWFTILTPVSFILYIIYSLLFGITFSFIILGYRHKICSVSKSSGAKFSGTLGTAITIILPQCGACISLAAIFLPLSVVSLFLRYKIEVMAVSIALLVFSLWISGAFNKTAVNS